MNHAGEIRSILNVNDLLNTLNKAFPQHHVVLKYFENSISQEQVDFYSQQDVVVSLHGAQLT